MIYIDIQEILMELAFSALTGKRAQKCVELGRLESTGPTK